MSHRVLTFRASNGSTIEYGWMHGEIVISTNDLSNLRVDVLEVDAVAALREFTLLRVGEPVDIEKDASDIRRSLEAGALHDYGSVGLGEVKKNQLTKDQLKWVADWLAQEGFRRPPADFSLS